VILQPRRLHTPFLGRLAESSCFELPPFAGHIIHFAAEHKRSSSATNQITYDLSTALYHKRALGLKVQKVFGASTYKGTRMTGWIAHWDEDVVRDDIM
jgi:hypothetical protein